MSTNTQTQSNHIDSFIEPTQFPREKVNEIIARIRKAEYKFTAAGRLREQVKALPADYKTEILHMLRCASLESGNADVAKYVKEIIN